MALFRVRRRRPAINTQAIAFEVKVVDINNRMFAANLFWQPLSRARNFMAEARELGKKRDWDIVAVRRGHRGTRVQAGFAPRRSAAAKGMYSLAASLAGKLGDSWLGAFKLKDGRYVVTAVFEGMICIGFDDICDAERARELLRDASSLHQFEDDAIYAPPELEFSAQSRDIYELLTPKTLSKEHRLRQLTFGLTKRELAYTVVGAAVVLGSLGAYLAYQVHEQSVQAEQRRRQAEEQRRRLAELNLKTHRKLVAQALVHPWAVMPSALDYAKACVASEDQFHLSLAGWPLSEIDCDGRSVSATYTRSGSLTVDSFIAEVTALYGHPPLIQGDDEDKGIVKVVDMAVPVAGDDPLWRPDDLMPRFHSYFEGTGIAATVTAGAAVATKAASAPVAVKTWNEYSYSFEHSLPPTYHFPRLLEAMGRLDGVRIRKITETVNADAGDASWKVEGTVYVQK